MKNPVSDILQSLSKNESGATLVEYVIAISLAVSIGTVSLATLATVINSNVGEAEATMQ